MKIKFLYPRWGSENIPWPQFLADVKNAGYSGIEWFPYGETCDTEEVLRLLDYYELDFAIVMQVIKPYTGYEIYLTDLEKELLDLSCLQSNHKAPLFISAQTGREFFNEAQIIACEKIAKSVEAKSGVKIFHETHRNKWAYAAHVVEPLLKQLPDIRLTLDISHWFCVSESYLEDQQEAVNTALHHTHHIHARVGYTESPQVFDPSLEEYQLALQEHLKVWDRWIAQRKKKGFKISTITPEFGPPPYMVPAGRTIDLQQEQWRINAWMKELLQKRYNTL